jgi:hypothetical protein
VPVVGGVIHGVSFDCFAGYGAVTAVELPQRSRYINIASFGDGVG